MGRTRKENQQVALTSEDTQESPDSGLEFDDLPNVEWMPISTFYRYLRGISMRTLRRWAENGDIPASKRGTGRWAINVRALKALRVDTYRHDRAREATQSGILMFDDESVDFE